MKILWLYYVAILFVITGSQGIYTGSFFHDFEEQEGNMIGATELDISLSGEPLDGLLCATSEVRDTTITLRNLSPNEVQYSLDTMTATGTLCADLDLTVTSAATELYAGPLSGLMITDVPLPAATSTELSFAVGLSPSASNVGSCAFVFEAISSFTTGGFIDREIATGTISGSAAGSGGGCQPQDPTVNLYLNKHISGADQGFALSDFSYRITGDAVDLAVPHDSFTPLPEGTYSIEELVPVGFEKTDWRIGWYGQCEASDNFSTTITIDAGNIDHGVLYCEADNQYRPGHGDHEIREANTNETAVREPEIADTGDSEGRRGSARPESGGSNRSRGSDTTVAEPVFTTVSATSSGLFTASIPDNSDDDNEEHTFEPAVERADEAIDTDNLVTDTVETIEADALLEPDVEETTPAVVEVVVSDEAEESVISE